MKAKLPDEIRTRRKVLPRSGSIARDIGAMILSGRYKPGDLLDGEVSASLRLRVARSTYREAMRILSAKGMLEMRPHVGTRVTPMEQWHWLDPEVLGWTFDLQHDTRLTSSIFEMRRAVGPEAAALAAQRRTTENLMDLRCALSQMQTSAHPEQSAEPMFWKVLFRSSHNVYLGSLGHTIEKAVASIADRGASTSRAQVAVQQYVDVYDAVAARDSVSAREAMYDLVARPRLYAGRRMRADAAGYVE